jgi:hypothetical protein
MTGNTSVQVTRLDTARIRAARRVIVPVFLGSPLYRCEALEPVLGCAVSIKLETANPVRSFKARGTEVVASQLSPVMARGPWCAPARATSARPSPGPGAAGGLTSPSWPRFAPAAKLDRIRALEARLELADGDIETARERAAAIARRDGIRLVAAALEDRGRFAGRHVVTIVCGSNVDTPIAAGSARLPPTAPDKSPLRLTRDRQCPGQAEWSSPAQAGQNGDAPAGPAKHTATLRDREGPPGATESPYSPI